MLSALYFVLSAMLKIPVGGHITPDLGYIALTVGAVYPGAAPVMFIGSVGALLESALMSQRGVSPGWISDFLRSSFNYRIVVYPCGRGDFTRENDGNVFD